MLKNSYQLALVEYENTKSRMQKIKAVENVIDKQSYEDMKAKFDAANLNFKQSKNQYSLL